jgi:hypothetical protein
LDHQAFAQILGGYGEFVGSVAILITLVYLSIQVRQVKRQQEIEDRQHREFAIRDYQMNFATSEGLAQAVTNARDAVGEQPHGFVTKLLESGVSRTDAERVWSYYVAGIRIGANTYYTSTDELQREASNAVMRLSYSDGIGALFWEHYSKAGPALGPFGEHVNNLLNSDSGNSGGVGVSG